MEGLPKSQMLALPIKHPLDGFPSDFKLRVKEYILLHYQNDPDKFEDAIDEIVRIRNNLSNVTPDMEQILILKRYYAQMRFMKNRFPMEKGEPLAVPLLWAEYSSDIGGQLAISDINFELVLILHNISACHSTIAVSEPRNSSDSIKNAYMNFQWAAGAIKMICEEYNVLAFEVFEIDAIYLNWSMGLFLAQAQECILEKAISDKRKPVVISQLATSASTLYSECTAKLQDRTLRDRISSSVLNESERHCQTKAELFGAIKNYYLGLQCQTEEKPGHAVKYMEMAKQGIQNAAKTADKDKKKGLKDTIVFAKGIIDKDEEKIRKENDIVYNAKIASISELPKVEQKLMTEAIIFDANDRSVSGEDLFKELLPTEVIKGVSVFEEIKLEFKNQIKDKIERADVELENYLLALKLEKLNLDKPLKEFDLPEELLECCACFHRQPDLFAKFLSKLDEVIKLSEDSERLLIAIKTDILRIKDGNIVTDDSFNKIATTIEGLAERHAQAKACNKTIQKAIAEHSCNMKILAMPLDEIRLKLNDGLEGVNFTPLETTEGKKLKSVLNKIDEMRTQRYKFLKDLMVEVDNTEFYKMLMEEKYCNQEDMARKALEKHDNQVRLINLNIAAQENILSALTDANADFADRRKQIQDFSEKRLSKAAEFVASFESVSHGFEEIDKGMDFFRQALKLMNPISKNIEKIKSSHQKEIEEKEKRKILDEQRRKDQILADDTADFMDFFTGGGTAPPKQDEYDLPAYSRPNPKPVPATNRGKKQDMLAFYREKMAKTNPQPDSGYSAQPAYSNPNNGPYQQPSGNYMQQAANNYGFQAPQTPINHYSNQGPVKHPLPVKNESNGIYQNQHTSENFSQFPSYPYSSPVAFSNSIAASQVPSHGASIVPSHTNVMGSNQNFNNVPKYNQQVAPGYNNSQTPSQAFNGHSAGYNYGPSQIQQQNIPQMQQQFVPQVQKQQIPPQMQQQFAPQMQQPFVPQVQQQFVPQVQQQPAQVQQHPAQVQQHPAQVQQHPAQVQQQTPLVINAIQPEISALSHPIASQQPSPTQNSYRLPSPQIPYQQAPNQQPYVSPWHQNPQQGQNKFVSPFMAAQPKRF
uniref:BRO1 domain-containing protein n=1 Tax=Rhabditophanes sp. KR3021 TaxID=114890 RepID=A0AC35TU37_9BILA